MIDTPENFSPRGKQETSPGPFTDKKREEYRKAPCIRGEPIESPDNITAQVLMTFNQAMEVLLQGGSVQRLSWSESAVVIKFIAEKLHIYGRPDNLWHPLIVRIGDVTGTDWREVES